LQELSDQVSDAPEAPKWFFEVVLKPLLDAEYLPVRSLRWCLDDQDDIYAVGASFVVASLVANYY
jgi:hypothetical protein